jgi:ATP-dependent protease Clp ATPase subunit
MGDTMFELPGKTDVRECVVTDEVINKKSEPMLVYQNEAGAPTQPQRPRA